MQNQNPVTGKVTSEEASELLSKCLLDEEFLKEHYEKVILHVKKDKEISDKLFLISNPNKDGIGDLMDELGIRRCF